MEPKQGYNVIPYQYNLQELESNLREILQPVVPTPDFVVDLKKRLLRYPRWKIALPGIFKSIMLGRSNFPYTFGNLNLRVEPSVI